MIGRQMIVRFMMRGTKFRANRKNNFPLGDFMVKRVVEQPDIIQLYMEIAAFSDKPCIFLP